MRILEIGTWLLTGLIVVVVIGMILLQSVFGVSFAPSSVSESEAKGLTSQANRDRWKAVDAPVVDGKKVQLVVPTAIRDEVKREAKGEGGGIGELDPWGTRGGEGGGKGPGGNGPGGPGAPGAGGAAGGSGLGQGQVVGTGYRVNNEGAIEQDAWVLPRMVVDRFRHAPEARSALQSAESWDIPYAGGTAVQLGRMALDSPLATHLGLQEGDIVVAVNGHQVSRENGMALHARLKDETQFRVEIDRNGTRIIAKYEIQ